MHLNNSWIWLNLPEWLLFYFPIVIPCLLECMVTYFTVYTNLEVLWGFHEGLWGCFLGGVIRIVRTLGEGSGGPAKSVMAHIRGTGEVQLYVYVRHKFFFAGLLQNRNEIKSAIQIAKIIHSYLPCKVKKGKLDPRALLDILIWHFW